MTYRDSRGRFVKVPDPFSPFRQGRMVDQKMFDLSLQTFMALNHALDQAESDVRRYDAVS